MGALTRRDAFEALADAVCRPVPGAERITLFLAAESSDFLRFNRGAVRQSTHVDQGYATVAAMRGRRRIESTCSLTGDLAADVAALSAERAALVAALDDVPDDPYLLLPEDGVDRVRHDTGRLPDPGRVVDAVATAARGLDFVGFHAAGPVVRAFADSRGRRHWHHVENFHFDWCLYRQGDQAIKQSLAGTHWDDDAFARRVAEGAARLPLLERAPRALVPGAYRAYFTPAAMAELLATLGWQGFGAQARRTGTSALGRLERGEASLHERVTLVEDIAHGSAPAFTAAGFVRPDQVRLVERGRAAGTLNSPRSAAQYGLAANGAEPAEQPDSLHLAPGTLAEPDVLAALGTGLYVSNLWYLNYSDRQACRMTGMTRFACFWVEGGRLVAPLPVMRFDDSFLRMAGEGLLALTERSETIPDSDTYRERQLRSITTPGALVEGWRLTL